VKVPLRPNHSLQIHCYKLREDRFLDEHIKGMFLICLSLDFRYLFPTLHAQEMTLQKMESLLQEHTEELDGEGGAWSAFFEDHILLILTDEASNRMRIFSPIMELREADPTDLEKMLEANSTPPSMLNTASITVSSSAYSLTPSKNSILINLWMPSGR
jgi:hypothetical protein